MKMTRGCWEILNINRTTNENDRAAADVVLLTLCCSLEEQMDQASVVYMDLLEGTDQPAAGSTCKSLDP